MSKNKPVMTFRHVRKDRTGDEARDFVDGIAVWKNVSEKNGQEFYGVSIPPHMDIYVNGRKLPKDDFYHNISVWPHDVMFFEPKGKPAAANTEDDEGGEDSPF